MSTNEIDIWDSVISKLAAQTRAGEVQWQPTKQNRDTHDTLRGEIYFTEVEGKLIRVYEYEYEYYLSDEDRSVPAQDVSIEFITSEGAKLWELPRTPSRGSLMSAIRYRAAGADDFLQRFLRKAS